MSVDRLMMLVIIDNHCDFFVAFASAEIRCRIAVLLQLQVTAWSQ